MTRYGPLERLTADHDTSEFDCGSDAQTNWLRKHALQAQAAETAAVYVVCAARSRRVVGYFALAAGSVELSEAPGRVTRGTGRYPIPVILLARLGVDASEQGRGLGRALMKEVLLRTSEAADTVGARALLIHAESEAARSFYQHLAEFEPSPTDALHLFLLMKDLRATIDERLDSTS
ncbi:MAG: GNAT family N-acetyltransferase [Chloroflexi bacterium]|nr:GNAT family N-acetyltransferase [Chloroflexota bacterium]